jgi:hypothetical protein
MNAQGPPSSPDSIDPKQLRSRRWPIVVVLVAVLAIAAVTLLVAGARMSRASREREARAWSTLQRCLVGPDALGARESPSLRLRRIQLTAVGIAWRAKGQDAWPGWCSPRAHALHEALREAGHAQNGAEDLAFWSEHLGKQLHDHPYPESDIGPLADALWAAARAQGLPASDADDVPGTPAAAQPLTADALQPVPSLSPSAFPLDLVHDERVPTESVRLLVDGAQAPRAPYLCTAMAGADVLACATLPPSIKDGQVRLLGAADEGASPLLFTVPSGEAGIYRSSDGTLLDEAMSYGGFVRADGFAADLAWDRARKQFRLRRARPGQPPRDTGFTLDGVENDAQVAMLWDAVVWAANGSVSVRHVLDGDAPTGAAAVVASVPDGGISSRTPLRACRTKQALALFVHGAYTDTVTIDTGERWSTPATYEAVSGRAEAITCRGSDAALTALRAVKEAGWVEGRVTRVHCSPGACESRTTELAKVFPDAKETMPVRLAAADVDGELLLVWQAGSVGGLRMRYAPQDHIEEATDTVIYDDLMQNGALAPASTLLGWDLFSRGTFAILVLSTTSGVHAVRIDGSSKVTPLRVEWGAVAQGG